MKSHTAIRTLLLLLPAFLTALPQPPSHASPPNLISRHATIPACCTAALNAQTANGPNAALEIQNAVDACERAGPNCGISGGAATEATSSSSDDNVSAYNASAVADGGAGTYKPTLWHDGCMPCPGDYGPKGCFCEDCGWMSCKAAS